MAYEILLPKLGFSMDRGKIVEWLVTDGTAVGMGTPIYSLEDDKAVQEVGAPCSGTIRIKAPVGQELEVGCLIAIIE
jgi:pyruvate/2-oxoglutarate dehydrogenase complex dihydrolipoamide acyltransferase (E2) component